MVAPEIVEGVSGAVAGMAALSATYPLMTVSTLQATRSQKKYTVVPTDKKAATGTVADIAEVILCFITAHQEVVCMQILR